MSHLHPASTLPEAGASPASQGEPAYFETFGVHTNSKDLLALAELVVSLDKPLTRIVEVGSWTGRSALSMVSVPKPVLVYCIDQWEGSFSPPDDPGYSGQPGDNRPLEETRLIAQSVGSDKVFQTFCKNLRGHLFRSVVPVKMSSLEAAKIWPFPVDLIFIDAEHSEPACAWDILSWIRHLKPGGTLAVHDYGLFPGVTRAVDKVFPALGLEFRICGNSLAVAKVGHIDPVNLPPIP